MNAYLRRRNAIAREFGSKEIKHPVDWRTADHKLHTDIREDAGGLGILESFAKMLAHIKGPTRFADDGEGIAIWCGGLAQIRADWRRQQEGLRKKASRYALFHPGYLPRKVLPEELAILRVQNPNYSPYYQLGAVDWLWTIHYDPAKITCDFSEYEFNETAAGVLTTAEISHGLLSEGKPVLERPYVTTQARMDQVLADVAEYRRKLEIVRKRYAERNWPGDYREYVDTHRKKLWFRLS